MLIWTLTNLSTCVYAQSYIQKGKKKCMYPLHYHFFTIISSDWVQLKSCTVCFIRKYLHTITLTVQHCICTINNFCSTVEYTVYSKLWLPNLTLTDTVSPI